MAHLSPTRRLRRRERARRRQFLAGAILTTVLLALSLFQLSRTPPPAGPLGVTVATAGPFVLAATPLEAGAEADPERLTYPYSIIPGGAQSAAALKAAMDKDPVVRLHYANFNLAQTRVVRLTQPRVAHVSYRIGDDVFWTRRPLLLKAGETILTDGTHYARTRCANQIAMSPGALSPAEPSAEVLNTPLPKVTGAFAAYPLPGAGGGSEGGPMASAESGALYPGVAFPSGGSMAPRGGAAAIGGGGAAAAGEPSTGYPVTGDPSQGDPANPGSSSSAGGGATTTRLPPDSDPRSRPDGAGSTPDDPRPRPDGPGSTPYDPRPRPDLPRSRPNDPRSLPNNPNVSADPGDPSAAEPLPNGVKQIPEPAMLLLIGAGGAALFRKLRTRKRN